jgi:FSR family fosmidomycin resistance protein-like MFS transporter
MTRFKRTAAAMPGQPTANTAEDKGNFKGIGLMSVGHFIDDVYPGFLPPLLPIFIDKFGLSLTLAGVLGTVLALSTSVAQFGFGYLADRVGRRAFVVAGPLMACVFLSLMPLAPSYALLVVLLALGGLGVASFHPSAVSLTAAYATRRKNLAVSIFAAAGAVGFAAGSLFIISIVTTFGIERSYLAMIPGLIMVAFLARSTPRVPDHPADAATRQSSILKHSKLLFWVWLVAVIRAAVIMGFESFIPVIMKEGGGSLLSGGTALFLFLLFGSAGGVLGGYLSDRVDPRKVLLFSSVAPVPLLIAFLKVAPPFDLIALAFAGAFLFAGVPLTIVMAQEAVPGRTGTASSLAMGVAWGFGGFSSAGVGALGDMIGVTDALFVLALVSLVSAPFVLFLPGRKAEPRLVPSP